MDQPNIIGNVDDPQTLQSAFPEPTSPLAAVEEGASELQLADHSEFKDITPQLKYAKRNRSKPRY